jgi:dTDP-glucose pyrophosphorylase
LIPAAGFGSRFEQAGYTFPKPLIEVNGKPMIQLVVENLGFEANYIYVVRKEHYDKYNLKSLLNLITPNCKIIQVDNVTEGAACTTLLAKEFIDSDQPLIIANSDQFIEWNPVDFYYKMIETKADAGILTFNSTHPKFSYVRLDELENVIEVAEKVVISNVATVGVYYSKKGSDYVKYAEQMIKKNIRTNNEFYTAPVFQEFILDKKKIKTFNVNKMWSLGDPESLETYLKSHGE